MPQASWLVGRIASGSSSRRGEALSEMLTACSLVTRPGRRTVGQLGDFCFRPAATLFGGVKSLALCLASVLDIHAGERAATAA